MHSSDRNELRKVFFDAWQKHLRKLPVEMLETQIIDILLQHPEYHELLSHPENFQEKDFDEHNPFLHLSLHLALREQLATNRPAGIQQIFQTLCKKKQNTLDAEHQMIECLAEVLWEAQRSGVMPSEENYLERLKQIV
jgi:hypothetical protein